jgi:hypothetical protein
MERKDNYSFGTCKSKFKKPFANQIIFSPEYLII